MNYRGLIFFILAVAASSLHADADRQRLDTDILSTNYLFDIPADALPIGELTDHYVNISVSAKYSLFSLMGEPVVFCTATWKLESLEHNGVSAISDIPPEVLKKVELYNLKLELNFVNGTDAAIACDAGVPYPNGSANPSFNVPASPSWDQLFHTSVAAHTTEAQYIKEINHLFPEKKAKELFVNVIRANNNYPSVRVLNAKIDVSPIKYYLLDQQKDQLQKIQASLPKPTQSNKQLNDTDLFSQVVEKAFVEKQVEQVSKKITQSRNASASTESSARINHEKKQRLQQQCAGFAMPETSLQQFALTDDNLSVCSYQLEVYRDDNTRLYGYKDQHGNIKIPAKFSKVKKFYKNIALVQHPETWSWGAIDRAGREVLSLRYIDLKISEDENGVDVIDASIRNDKEGFCDNVTYYRTTARFDLRGNQIGQEKHQVVHTSELCLRFM